MTEEGVRGTKEELGDIGRGQGDMGRNWVAQEGIWVT